MVSLRVLRRELVGAAALLCTACAAPGMAATKCAVADLMPDFWKTLGAPDAQTRMRETVIAPHPELYNPDYVSIPAGPKWRELLARDREYVEAHRQQVMEVERWLARSVQPIMAEFRHTFPDYRCDFTFYIAPSFGRMDGSAAFIDGQHRIIFAPDVIPRYHTLAQLEVLVDHETFHIYHHQATDVFGASAEAVPSTLEALWGEGLATFVSWRMNPQVSLDVAMLQPGIPEGAQPHLKEIAQDLLAHLDRKDATTYEHYFVASRQPEGYPPRAGYYVGLLIAQTLSARYTLPQLAHLKGPELSALIVQELRAMARK